MKTTAHTFEITVPNLKKWDITDFDASKHISTEDVRGCGIAQKHLFGTSHR